MAETTKSNGTIVDEKCARLGERVAELERALAQAQRTISAVEKERNRYLDALYAWSRAQVTEEQLQRWVSEENLGMTFDEVLADLSASKGS